MKKQKQFTKEGMTKASMRTKVHVLQKEIIDFLTRHTVQDALKRGFGPVSDITNL